jgi:hypothetical protein
MGVDMVFAIWVPNVLIGVVAMWLAFDAVKSHAPGGKAECLEERRVSC